MELAIDHFLEREYDNNQRSHSLSDKAYFLLFTGNYAKAEQKAREAREIYDKCKDGTVSNMTFEESLFSDINELIQYQVIDSSIKEDLESFLNNQ